MPSTKPKAGLWKSTTGDEFYVTPNQNSVDNFAIYLNACGTTWKITNTPLVPISNKHFSFTGAFYASGTFNTTTKVTGQDGLNYLYLPSPCSGYLTAGPWSYTAVWKNTTQPTAVSAVLNLVEKLGMTDLDLPSPYHVVEMVAP